MRIIVKVDKAHFGNQVELAIDVTDVVLLHKDTVVSIIINNSILEIASSAMSDVHFMLLNESLDELKSHEGVCLMRSLITTVKAT